MESKELIRKRKSIWNKPGLIFWPLLGTILIWLLKIAFADSLHVYIPLVVTGLAVMTWLVAWIMVRAYTYIVFEDSVYQQRKFISRRTAEARISVIRSINIHQSLYHRILRIGDVIFKTAGDMEDVIFKGVPDPEGIKRIVQQQHAALSRGGDDAETGKEDEK